MIQLLALVFFGLAAIWFAIRVFMTDSMVRSAFALLALMAAIGIMMMIMNTEFLGVLQLMMMAGEMSIMAIFMMMYMMDPGGMEGMDMTHQKRASIALAIIGGLAVLMIVILAGFGEGSSSTAPDAATQIELLGKEIMGRSMLIFETAGVTIMATMVAATSLALIKSGKKEDGKS
jgi:NADH:ubiquinone oxidoreductase subunit 6 (subunit J)